jgi:hypothetical protein
MAGLEREERATGRKYNGQGQPQPVASSNAPAGLKKRKKKRADQQQPASAKAARTIHRGQVKGSLHLL